MPTYTYLRPVLAALCLSFACEKEPTVPPVALVEPEPVAEPEPEPVPVGLQRRVTDNALAVGTFNLQWAHDSITTGSTKLARKHQAQTEADWTWKLQGIAKVLVAQRLDVIAVQEVGGESELLDIVEAVEKAGGPRYSFAWVESTDVYTGHQVALLSRFPISNERRFNVHMRRHVVADIEHPDGTMITFVAFHARSGGYSAHKKARTKQARALKRAIEKARKIYPVVVLGTANAGTTPEEKSYRSGSAGMLAGAATRSPEDDCEDSAAFFSGQRTTVAGKLADRIFSCGLVLVGAESGGEETIVRDDPDPDGRAPWTHVPVNDTPYRDVSDHLVLWAELEMPKPPEPEPTQRSTTADPTKVAAK